MDKKLTDELVFRSIMLLSEISLTKNPGVKIKKRADELLKAVRAVQLTWVKNEPVTSSVI